MHLLCTQIAPPSHTKKEGNSIEHRVCIARCKAHNKIGPINKPIAQFQVHVTCAGEKGCTAIIVSMPTHELD